ncbi:flagellar filament capping protein FliD [Bacillus sp. FJAT-44742]|uniref:flagellar filament capping protein FliD n=1 Tax=Bacillus sp. FJAT-44742 TaxID=2014005 RepID=UPI000C25114F|nr:flagellar filament capping protein FliD [Bacillus sp. FJAT-44742]
MRLSGFASGMDTDQMIRDLMRVERMPMDKMFQQKQIIEWQMESYREVNRMFDTFRTNIFDTLMRSANMLARTVSSSDDSRVTATAASTAGNSSFRITEVSQLASAASQNSSDPISDGTLDASEALHTQALSEDMEWKQGVFNQETKRVDQAGTTFYFEKEPIKADALEDTVVKIGGRSYEVVTEGEAGSLSSGQVLVTKEEDGRLRLDFADTVSRGAQVNVQYITEGEGRYTTGSITTFTTNGEEVKNSFIVRDGQTMNQVLQEISRSNTVVNVFYDSFSDKVSVTRTQTGSFNPGGNEILFEGDFFTRALKLSNDGEPGSQGGQNAVFTLNGLETERTNNTFTINGMTLTLRDTFGVDDPPVTLAASIDTDKVFQTIKGFVDEYNEMLEKVNGMLTETRYRDYPPLTDEQKEAMSDREIEKWEERAQSGMIRNDRVISGALDRFRTDIYGSVTSILDTEFRQLATIGITTSRDYTERGKLEIDETKLRAAIEADPDGVFALFTADGPTAAEKGIGRRLRDSLGQSIDRIADRAGGLRGKVQNHQFTLGRNIRSIDQRISDFERRLQQTEERFWRQFTAMEKAMAQANNQANMIYSQMFGMY